jgi:hypothetical protein
MKLLVYVKGIALGLELEKLFVLSSTLTIE